MKGQNYLRNLHESVYFFSLLIYGGFYRLNTLEQLKCQFEQIIGMYKSTRLNNNEIGILIYILLNENFDLILFQVKRREDHSARNVKSSFAALLSGLKGKIF